MSSMISLPIFIYVVGRKKDFARNFFDDEVLFLQRMRVVTLGVDCLRKHISLSRKQHANTCMYANAYIYW